MHTSDGMTCCMNIFYCATFALGASLKFESCTRVSCNACNAKMPRCVPCSDLKCSTRPLLVSIKTSETGIRMHSYLRKPHTRFIAPHKRHTHESYAQNTSQQTWLRLVRRSPSFVCCFRSFGCVDFCSSCSWSRAVPVFWFDVLLLASSFLRPFGWGSNLASPLWLRSLSPWSLPPVRFRCLRLALLSRFPVTFRDPSWLCSSTLCRALAPIWLAIKSPLGSTLGGAWARFPDSFLLFG